MALRPGEDQNSVSVAPQKGLASCKIKKKKFKEQNQFLGNEVTCVIYFIDEAF